MIDQTRVAASIGRLLKQSKIWITADGVPHDLNALTAKQRAALVPYLRGWAPFLDVDIESTPLMQRLTSEGF